MNHLLPADDSHEISNLSGYKIFTKNKYGPFLEIFVPHAYVPSYSSTMHAQLSIRAR